MVTVSWRQRLDQQLSEQGFRWWLVEAGGLEVRHLEDKSLRWMFGLQVEELYRRLD